MVLCILYNALSFVKRLAITYYNNLGEKGKMTNIKTTNDKTTNDKTTNDKTTNNKTTNDKTYNNEMRNMQTKEKKTSYKQTRYEKTRKARFFAFIMALLMVITSLDITAIADEAVAEEETVLTAGYDLSNPTKDANGNTVYNCVWFGNYWQNDTNGDGTADKNDSKEPIKWRVLSVEGDKALLLADQILDFQKYNETNAKVTWETCSLRSWLNGYDAESNVSNISYIADSFLGSAFSQTEKDAILSANLANADNSEKGTEGGNDTTDYVFLLSLADVVNTTYGFESVKTQQDNARRATNTAFSKERGAYHSYKIEFYANGNWWLRSPGSNSYYGANVYNSGFVSSQGGIINNSDKLGNAIRPALYLDLSASAAWSKAGDVTANGETAENPYKLYNPRMDANGNSVWDCIWFGNYYQKDTNKDGKADREDQKTPIKWRVLSIQDDVALLISDKCLDEYWMHSSCATAPWRDCAMRIWLNGLAEEYDDTNFIDNAFSKEEQKAMVATYLDNGGMDPFWGNLETNDKVILLTMSDVMSNGYGFEWSYDPSATRIAENTDFAKDQGARMYTYQGYDGFGSWWIRDSGAECYTNSYVFISGSIALNGVNLNTRGYAVRPVIRLDLTQTSLWSSAGTIASADIDFDRTEDRPEGGSNDNSDNNSDGDKTDSGVSDNEVSCNECPNIVVKQKVDIRNLLGLSVTELAKVKKYQVTYQGAKNSRYASVNSKGVLTAKKVEKDGKSIPVKIEALDADKKVMASCYVAIVGTSLDKTKVTALTHIGETFDMNQALINLPANGYDQILWSVPASSKAAAIDTKTGIVAALEKSGKVRVTAEFVNNKNGIKSAKISVLLTVKLPRQSAKAVKVRTEKNKTIKLSNLSGQKIEWSVDNSSVISCNSVNGFDNGKGMNSVVINGKSIGSAKVTAIVDGDTEHPYVFDVTVKR